MRLFFLFLRLIAPPIESHLTIGINFTQKLCHVYNEYIETNSGETKMRNDRQTYYSGNFDCSGTSYAAPVRAMDRQAGHSVILVISAIVLLGIVCDLIISRI